MSESYPTLDDAAIENIVAASLAGAPLDGLRMLPLVARLIVRHAHPRAKAVAFLLALSARPRLDDDAMNQLFGVTPQERPLLFSDVIPSNAGLL